MTGTPQSRPLSGWPKKGGQRIANKHRKSDPSPFSGLCYLSPWLQPGAGQLQPQAGGLGGCPPIYFPLWVGGV